MCRLNLRDDIPAHFRDDTLFKTGDIALRDAEAVGDLLLRHGLGQIDAEAHGDDLPLARRQPGKRAQQRAGSWQTGVHLHPAAAGPAPRLGHERPDGRNAAGRRSGLLCRAVDGPQLFCIYSYRCRTIKALTNKLIIVHTKFKAQ